MLHKFPQQPHARIQVLGRLKRMYQIPMDALVLRRRLAVALLAPQEALLVALVQIDPPTSKLQLPRHRPGVGVSQPQPRMPQTLNMTPG